MGAKLRSTAIEFFLWVRQPALRARLLGAMGSAIALAAVGIAPAGAQQSGNGSVIVDYGVLEQLGTPATIPGGLTNQPPGPAYAQPYGAYPQPQPYGAYGQQPYAGTPQLLNPPASMPRSTLTVPYKPSPSIVDAKPAFKPTQQAVSAPAAAAPPPAPSPAPASPPAPQAAATETPPAPAAVEPAAPAAPAPAAPATPAPAAEATSAPAAPSAATAPTNTTTTANGVAVSTNVPTPGGGTAAPTPSSESSAESNEAGATNETSEAAEAAAPAAPAAPAAGETAAPAQAAAPATAETQNAALPPAAGAGEAGTGEKTQILFAEGSAELPPEATSQLDAIADRLAKDESLRLQLMAYASGTEDTASKARRISLSRALAVRAYLIDKGIRSTRMDVRALGNKVEGEPADRVDIVAQPAQ